MSSCELITVHGSGPRRPCPRSKNYISGNLVVLRPSKYPCNWSKVSRHGCTTSYYHVLPSICSSWTSPGGFICCWGLASCWSAASLPSRTRTIRTRSAGPAGPLGVAPPSWLFQDEVMVSLGWFWGIPVYPHDYPWLRKPPHGLFGNPKWS